MTSAKEKYQSRTEILQGTLDMLILQVLHWGPRHGYALSKVIRTDSGEILKLDAGSLYPALHRLERRRMESFGIWPKVESLSPDEIGAQTVSRGTLRAGLN